MTVKSYILQRLGGAFETALLMPSGIKKFDGTPRETLLSFLVLVISIPLSYISISTFPPLGTHDIETIKVVGVHRFSWAISFLIGLGMIYAFARYVTGGNTQKIWLYYTLANWVTLLFIPLNSFFLFLYAQGVFADKTLTDVYLVIRLYGYLIGGFVIYRVFNPPWELAAAMACFFLVMGQVVLKTSYVIFDFPLVDYMQVYGPTAMERAAEEAARAAAAAAETAGNGGE